MEKGWYLLNDKDGHYVKRRRRVVLPEMYFYMVLLLLRGKAFLTKRTKINRILAK